MFSLSSIVLCVVGVGVVEIMLFSLTERTIEFGVLKALGAGPFTVLRLIVTEGAIQTGLACLVGVGASLPVLHYLTHTGIDVGRPNVEFEGRMDLKTCSLQVSGAGAELRGHVLLEGAYDRSGGFSKGRMQLAADRLTIKKIGRAHV